MNVASTSTRATHILRRGGYHSHLPWPLLTSFNGAHRVSRSAVGAQAISARRASTLTGVSNDEVQSSRSYCLELIKRLDTPSYTLLPFIPSSARDTNLAIRALNIEVARIADNTSHASISAMRMQFWRDTIQTSLSLQPRHEPVAILLAHAAASIPTPRPLNKTWLNRLVSAREARLNNPPWPNLASIETYAEHTYATLLYLTLSAIPLASVAADHLASHIGKAHGIAAVLRGVPLLAFPAQQTGAGSHASTRGTGSAALGGALDGAARVQGAVSLPLDVMAEAGVREEDVLRYGADAKGLRDAVFAVATRASDHLITAREMLRGLRRGEGMGHEFEHEHEEEFVYEAETQTGSPGKTSQLDEVNRAFGVFMPAVSTQMWLDKLQGVDFDIFHPSLRHSRSDWKLPLKAYWAFTRKQL